MSRKNMDSSSYRNRVVARVTVGPLAEVVTAAVAGIVLLVTG